jgi:hypothetical protein
MARFAGLHNTILGFELVKQVLFDIFLAHFAHLHNNPLGFVLVKQLVFEIFWLALLAYTIIY